jgi:glycosyltransferase involved in cell wall biosynthesis
MKKNILMFNGYYVPAKNYGGPATSAENIVETCSDSFNFFIVAANHDFGDSTPFEGIKKGWNKVGRANVLYLEKKNYAFSILKMISLIKETDSSLIHLVGILKPHYRWAAIIACNFLQKPFLISPRGEVCEEAFNMKKTKKKIYSNVSNFIGIFRKGYFHATSTEEVEGLKKNFKIKKQKIFLVPNISLPSSQKRNYFKEKNKLKVVFISRIQEKKNLKYAIEVISKVKSIVQFDIFGPIESQEYWDSCKDLINEIPDNIKITYCGKLEPKSVGRKFMEYDCFLLPTISENYGHVIAESISNGCPVVISRNTTPWDDADKKAGFVIDLSDPDEFVRVLGNIAVMDNDNYQTLIRETLKYYKDKLIKNDAIKGHVNMYNKIIELGSK